jgi:small subunit ribosomal protein S21
MTIEVKVFGDLEKALRLLKKKVQREGLHRELKHRRFYEKPCVKKKRKRVEAARRKLKYKRFA